MKIDFTQRVILPDDVLVRELDGESVLLNLDTESYFGLDEVGTRMFAVLVDAPSIEAAFATLLDEYDVTAAQLRSDLQELVGQLTEHGLLRVVGDD